MACERFGWFEVKRAKHRRGRLAAILKTLSNSNQHGRSMTEYRVCFGRLPHPRVVVLLRAHPPGGSLLPLDACSPVRHEPRDLGHSPTNLRISSADQFVGILPGELHRLRARQEQFRASMARWSPAGVRSPVTSTTRQAHLARVSVEGWQAP